MGRRGEVSKSTQMGTPCNVDLNWQPIEELRGNKLSDHAREDIEHTLNFYTSSNTAVKLPMSETKEYTKKLKKAYKALNRMPVSAQHALQMSGLKVLVWKANLYSQSEPDQTMKPWSCLIMDLCIPAKTLRILQNASEPQT